MNRLFSFLRRSKEEELDHLLKYFECEDDVEAALTWLDNHPNAELEEYENWLTHRENAIAKIKASKSETES